MDSETVHVSYQDSANVAHEVDLTKDMFTFKQADKKIHDVSSKASRRRLPGMPGSVSARTTPRLSPSLSSV
jgi:hypothetical protein